MTMQTRAFAPKGATVTATATASSATITIPWTVGSRAVRIVNFGANAINIEFGQGATVTATTTASMLMLGNTVEVFSTPTNTDRVAVIATSTTGSVVYVQSGEGL